MADPGTFVWAIPGTSLARVRELLPRRVSDLLSEAELNDLGDRLEEALDRGRRLD